MFRSAINLMLAMSVQAVATLLVLSCWWMPSMQWDLPELATVSVYRGDLLADQSHIGQTRRVHPATGDLSLVASYMVTEMSL